jgi:hypothetical protein
VASRLVLSSAAFAQQWVTAGGLAPACVQRLLADNNPSALLVDTLLVRVACVCGAVVVVMMIAMGAEC